MSPVSLALLICFAVSVSRPPSLKMPLSVAWTVNSWLPSIVQDQGPVGEFCLIYECACFGMGNIDSSTGVLMVAVVVVVRIVVGIKIMFA